MLMQSEMQPRTPHLRAVDGDTPSEQVSAQDRERALVAAAVAGDSAAWARLYQDNFDSLYRDARYLSRDAATAEELVQEAFAVGLTRLGKYDGRASFAGWIRGIIHNLARRVWRKDERRGRAYSGLGRTLELSGHGGEDPERDLVRRARARALAEALESLAPNLRETFVLRDVQGLDVEEVADRLGTTAGNIRVRANRARSKLRAILSEIGAMEARS